jgi:hypothetical protein
MYYRCMRRHLTTNSRGYEVLPDATANRMSLPQNSPSAPQLLLHTLRLFAHAFAYSASCVRWFLLCYSSNRAALRIFTAYVRWLTSSASCAMSNRTLGFSLSLASMASSSHFHSSISSTFLRFTVPVSSPAWYSTLTAYVRVDAFASWMQPLLLPRTGHSPLSASFEETLDRCLHNKTTHSLKLDDPAFYYCGTSRDV